MKENPAVIIAAIIGVVEAVIALLPLFGVPLTVEQMGAIMALVVAVGAAIGGIWTRSIVYAPATYAEAMAQEQIK